jgi:hypothetical protein
MYVYAVFVLGWFDLFILDQGIFIVGESSSSFKLLEYTSDLLIDNIKYVKFLAKSEFIKGSVS